MMNLRFRRHMQSEQGATAVEFAILVQVLVLLVFGIVEFGMAYSHYLAVTHAAREGARQASVGKFSEAKVRASAGLLSKDAALLIVGPLYPEGNLPGKPVELEVRYPEHIAIPIWGVRDIVLVSKATMRIE